MAIPRNGSEMLIVKVKMALDCLRIHAVTKDPQDLEFQISLWSMESYKFIVVWGEFGPMLKDVLNLTALCLHGETKAMSVSSEEEDEDKLQWLIAYLHPQF